MQLVIPREGFMLRSDPERIVIDTDASSKEDRLLTRQEVARRLNKTTRTIDVYRRLTGEARLHSETFRNRCVIKESEYKRWYTYINTQKNFILAENFDGSTSSFRPRKRRRNSVAGLCRISDIRAPA
jgi:hypothetical protein